MIQSIESTFEMLKEFNSNSVDALYLISQSVNGLRIQDINQIIKYQANEIIAKLEEMSLIVKDTDDHVYKV